VDELFRAFHSLKGMTDALGATGMKALAHRCEDVLGAARAQRVSVAGPVSSALLEAVDGLRRLRALMVSARRDAAPDAALLGRLGALAEGGGEAAPRAPVPSAPAGDNALLGSLASRFEESAPGLARLLRRGEGAAEAAAEARDMAGSAALLGLARLAATLRALADTPPGAAALPLLGRLRRQLAVLAERCGEPAGERPLASAIAAQAADALGPALSLLAPRLEAVVEGRNERPTAA
jgi:two-component system, chemotaxis family, sensor kinase CheA